MAGFAAQSPKAEIKVLVAGLLSEGSGEIPTPRLSHCYHIPGCRTEVPIFLLAVS